MMGCQLDCTKRQTPKRTRRSCINIHQTLFALVPVIYSSFTSRRMDITFTNLCQHQLLFRFIKTATMLIRNIFVHKK